MVKQQTRYLVFFIEPCKQAALSARAENRKRSNSFHASFHQEKILRRDTCISSSSLYAVCFMNTSNTCKKNSKIQYILPFAAFKFSMQWKYFTCKILIFQMFLTACIKDVAVAVICQSQLEESFVTKSSFVQAPRII